MRPPPALPTPEEWTALSFAEQVAAALDLVGYVTAVLGDHLAARQADGRPLSQSDMERIEALRLSLECLRRESTDGLPAGSLERSIRSALDVLGIAASDVRVS